MNPDKKNIPFFLHPMGFIECFTKLGADQNALLKAANLDQNIFSEQSLLISSKQQIALLHYGINTLQQEYLGFEVGLNFPWCYYGPLAGIVDTSPSLREAGAAFRRYAAIAQPNLKTLLADVNYYIGPEGDMVVPITPAMPENIDDPIRKFDLEFRTAITLRLFNTSGFQPERPAMDVMLQNKVALPISIVERLPVKNIFYESTKNAVSADPKFFATEWRQGRRSLFNDVISRCEQMYHNHGLYDSFTETIRWHIGARFLRSITVEQIASSLHMSPRSLARKLAEEGTNFKELVHVSKMNISLNHHARNKKLVRTNNWRNPILAPLNCRRTHKKSSKEK